MSSRSSRAPKRTGSRTRALARTRIGILCPSRFEFEAVRDLAVVSHAAIWVSGMGKVRAGSGVFEMSRKYPALRHILLIGFAGGLAGLRAGDLIEPDHVIEQDYCAEPFEKFPNELRLKGKALVKGSMRATLLTQDRFLKDNPYAGSTLAKKYPRLACDMEAYAVVWAAQRLKVSCSILKLISDEANADADHDFLKACIELRPKLHAAVQKAVEALS